MHVTYLGEMSKKDRAHCREVVLAMLERHGGMVGKVAQEIGCSRNALQVMIRERLGLRGVPEKIRRERAERFRLRPRGN